MSGLPNLAQRPRDVVVDAFLPKPFTLHELVEVIMPFCRPPMIVQAV
jgi:hypothetical protein